MKRDFLELYEQELEYLYDHAKDFSAEYPGIAERLGGLSRDGTDSGILSILEGAAFMAARVQMKIKSQYSEFTSELLRQLLPGYLSSIPSAMLVTAIPQYGQPGLVEGKTFEAGEYLEANYKQQGKDVSCRFRLSQRLQVWPLQLVSAQYHATTTALQALGIEVADSVASGLVLRLQHRTEALPKNSDEDTDTGAPVSALKIDELDFYLDGALGEISALYEQLIADTVRISLRHTNSYGVVTVRPLAANQLQQVGFSESEPLFPEYNAGFLGFALLKEFFAFPRKFIGFRISGLRRFIKNIPEAEFSLVFEFAKSKTLLQSAVRESTFRLFTAPAANIFEMQCSRIALKKSAHEFAVVPDRSRWLDYETIAVTEVFAHFQGVRQKVPVYPIYNMPAGENFSTNRLFYSTRTASRRATDQEKRFGLTPDYMGTDTFLTLSQPSRQEHDKPVRELSVRALCSNRHLPMYLPVGEGNDDFILLNDTEQPLRTIAGPTVPRAAIVDVDRPVDGSGQGSSIMWRLINFLSFNHLGLMQKQQEKGANGLRELLALFADMSDLIDERRIQGIVDISTTTTVKRIRSSSGFHAARGVKIELTFDEKAFEGLGILVFGAVLERFFAHYASINSFTQTVIHSSERGQIMRFPPRSGTGRVL